MPRNMDMSNIVERRNKMKKALLGCGIALGVFVLVVVMLIAGLLLLLRGEEQKPPQIETGEFPFVVEYEMNGKNYVIEDTVVCEFSGYDLSALTFNKPRSWRSKLKSGEKEKLIILREENMPSAIKEGRHNEWAELRVFYGSEEHYMGDPTAKSLVHRYPHFIYYETYTENGENRLGWGTELTEKELKKHFGITVKRFEFSEPIKNEFK